MAMAINPKDPKCTNLDEYLHLLWPQSLCDLIVVETNRYARSVANWVDVNKVYFYSFFSM